MKAAPPLPEDQPQSERGSALLMVVWGIGAMAALGAIMAADTHMDVQEANAAKQSFLARSLAESGLRLGARDWEAGSSSNLAASPLLCETDAGILRVEVRPTDALINLNLASESLLAGLFETLGTDQAEARALSEAVIDYRDPDNRTRSGNDESDLYNSVGLTGPANRAFLRPSELSSVAGMPAELAVRALPHVTTFSTTPAVNLEAADPVVRKAVQQSRGQSLLQPRDNGERDFQTNEIGRDEPDGKPIQGVSIFVRSVATTRSGYTAVAEATIERDKTSGRYTRPLTFRWSVLSPDEMPPQTGMSNMNCY